jgi:hypothetical protein
MCVCSAVWSNIEREKYFRKYEMVSWILFCHQLFLHLLRTAIVQISRLVYPVSRCWPWFDTFILHFIMTLTTHTLIWFLHHYIHPQIQNLQIKGYLYLLVQSICIWKKPCLFTCPTTWQSYLQHGTAWRNEVVFCYISREKLQLMLAKVLTYAQQIPYLR